jgi:hypothetical protein
MQPVYFKALLVAIAVWVWVAVLVLLLGALTHSLDTVLGLGAHRSGTDLWPGPALRAIGIGLIAALLMALVTLLLDRRPDPESATPR